METMFEKVELPEDKHKEVLEKLKTAQKGTYLVARGKYHHLHSLYAAVQTAGFDPKRRKRDDGDYDMYVTVKRGVNGHDGVKV